MAKIISIGKTLRNNWKKSTFGAVLITYGVRYAKEKHDCNVLMAEYCREALKYGDISYRAGTRIRNVTVFVNPAANKRKAKKDFDKYCAPLLYLAGIYVTVVQTKSQGEARSLAEQLGNSVDAIIVAGGDGTLSEVVTGLLRRETGEISFEKRIPVGILPLGQTNAVAKSLLGEDNSDRVKSMAEATMAVIKEIKKPMDVIRIEQLEKEREDQRPVYSVSGLRWGAVHDAYAKRDKYWYWGALRAYVAYVFMGTKGEEKGVTWNCSANLCYTLPCSGCSKCYLSPEPVRRKVQTRWWQSYVPKHASTFGVEDNTQIDYSKIKNDSCNILHELKVESVDVNFKVSNGKENHAQPEMPHIKVSIGPSSISYWDFITRGWQYIKGNDTESISTFHVKDIRLQPNLKATTQDTEHWFYIDNDDYEVKPIYIKLLPKRVIMFCQHQLTNSVAKENIN